MSYDLYIVPQARFGIEQFAAYFQGRSCYSASNDGGEVYYRNEETGVYFSFAFVPPRSEAELRSEIEIEPERAEDTQWLAQQRQPHVYFNMNFMRPHVFGIEAEPEVDSFIRAFRSTISDPQNEGMDGGPYSRAGFLRGWNAGNRFGYQVVLLHNERPVSHETLEGAVRKFGCVVAPSQDIADVWSWNFHIDQNQSAVEAKGHDVFVPKVVWGNERESQALIRVVIWRAGVATIFPGEASHVLIGREAKPGRFSARFGFGKRAKAVGEQYLLVRREDLMEVLPKKAHVHVNERDMIYCPARASAFNEVFWNRFGRLQSTSDPSSLIELVSPDSVLDADIFDALLSRVRTE